MKSQPVVTNRNIICQPAFDHIPAHQTLEASQQEDRTEPEGKALAYLTADDKPQKRDQEDQPDHPAP